ncbi:MAG: DotU family type IV/VI secretion system protein [bacterium]|nr:DotU family type IV/VI secretion system protein [bacterium]
MDLETSNSQIQSLSDICTDLFLLILYLRESQEFEPFDTLHHRINTLFHSMEERAIESKIADRDIQDARYALAAFLDEIIGWESRLELELFQSNIAGEEFFNKLEQIRKVKSRGEVLQVYSLCLLLGFEGKYALNPQRLQEYIKEFREGIKLKDVRQLSPSAEIPQEIIQRSQSSIPSWLPWTVTAVCGVGVVVIYIFLKFRLYGWAVDVVKQLQRLLIVS